jgi:hypothetical protein
MFYRFREEALSPFVDNLWKAILGKSGAFEAFCYEGLACQYGKPRPS